MNVSFENKISSVIDKTIFNRRNLIILQSKAKLVFIKTIIVLRYQIFIAIKLCKFKNKIQIVY